MIGANVTRSLFQQWSKRGFASFNELLNFSGTTCGYQLIQASYSQSVHFLQTAVGQA